MNPRQSRRFADKPSALLEWGRRWRAVQTTESQLRIYRFCSTTPDGSIDTACEMPAHSDEEARQIARNLVMEGEFQSIEVWRDEMKLYSISKKIIRAGHAKESPQSFLKKLPQPGEHGILLRVLTACTENG